MARMCSMCEHVSVFLREFQELVLHFSLLFPSFCIFPYSVLYSRVCFCELPFSILRFLVSPLCLFFFFDSSMVDYYAVKANFPSIAFFFDHLGSLLEFVEGSVLKGLVLSQERTVRILLFFLPCFLQFPILLRMSEVRSSDLLRMFEVRSSELEMGLSSSDDCVVSKATSFLLPICQDQYP